MNVSQSYLCSYSSTSSSPSSYSHDTNDEISSGSTCDGKSSKSSTTLYFSDGNVKSLPTIKELPESNFYNKSASQRTTIDVESIDTPSPQLNPTNEEYFCSPHQLLKYCALCFWSTTLEPELARHSNCFEPVHGASLALSGDSDSSPHRSCKPTLYQVGECKSQNERPIRVQFDSKTRKQKHIFPSILKLFHRQTREVDAMLRHTPMSVGSLASSTKYGTLSSSNTLHRRADISTEFFNLATLEAINSDHDATESSTPESMSNESDERRAKDLVRPAFLTPSRQRLNSALFRNNICEVTCEKQGASNDDVSPIESEEDFSLFAPLNVCKPALNMRSKTQVISSIEVKKRLLYDDIQENYHEVNRQNDERNEVNHSIGKAIESIRALAFRCQANGLRKNVQVSHDKSTKELNPKPQVKEEAPDEGVYLRQSVSFIKALRKSGCTGKVLIQGWVAFRQNMSWREVLVGTRRCDFRYIVLLDDMPILYIMSSKPKQKTGKPNTSLLDNCISIDLRNEVEVGIRLASKELGHEVYLIESESRNFTCGMLPVPMRNHAFKDKHRSCLDKGNALKEVFQAQRIIEQNDTSRHLLFVISAVITFPPPR